MIAMGIKKKGRFLRQAMGVSRHGALAGFSIRRKIFQSLERKRRYRYPSSAHQEVSQSNNNNRYTYNITIDWPQNSISAATRPSKDIKSRTRPVFSKSNQHHVSLQGDRRLGPVADATMCLLQGNKTATMAAWFVVLLPV